MLAIMFLPRQFQVAVIENKDERHLNKAIWLFPLYMLAINVFVLPIAFGGLLHFPDGTVDADTFVLTLPMAEKQEWLALLVFIGGLSAATGMVIVETIALSTMVCNDLVMPVLLRMRSAAPERARATSPALLLGIRRGAIVLILLLGYLYFRLAGEAYALVSIGLISFAAVAQFAPAALGGIFWKGGTRRGALAGLVAGFAVWFYTLLLPALRALGLAADRLAGARAVRHRAAQAAGSSSASSGLDQITHAMIWSMLANIGAYVAVSLLDAPERRRAPPGEPVRGRVQAPGDAPAALLARHRLGDRPARPAGALPRRRRAPTTRFAATRERRACAGPSSRSSADAELVHYVETQLAGAIGAPRRASWSPRW